MQKKHIAFVIIIQFLIKRPESTIGEIYNEFRIYPDGNGGYENRGNYPVTQRSISRYVNELVNIGMVQVVEDIQKKYKISDNMFVLKSITEKKELENLINILIEANEKYLLKEILDISSREELNNDSIDSILCRINNVIDFKDIDEKIEYTIEKAIVSSYNLQVTYKSKKYIISPIAIVNNSSGMKKYLFYLNKGKLMEPFILSKITFAKILNENFIKKKKYLEDINDRWDIEGGKGINIEIEFEKEIIPNIIKKLKTRKKAEITYDNNGNII